MRRNTNSEIMREALEEKADLHNVKTFAGGSSFKPNPLAWNVLNTELIAYNNNSVRTF